MLHSSSFLLAKKTLRIEISAILNQTALESLCIRGAGVFKTFYNFTYRRYVEGVPSVYGRFIKGLPFLSKMVYKKGKGLHLGAEPRALSLDMFCFVLVFLIKRETKRTTL